MARPPAALTTTASFEATDPNVERFTKVECFIQDAVRCYREINEEIKERNSLNKAEHVPRQENISYLNPRNDDMYSIAK
jgi:hypothetical protein